VNNEPWRPLCVASRVRRGGRICRTTRPHAGHPERPRRGDRHAGGGPSPVCHARCGSAHARQAHADVPLRTRVQDRQADHLRRVNVRSPDARWHRISSPLLSEFRHAAVHTEGACECIPTKTRSWYIS